MIKLTATTQEDLSQIQEWIAADPFHKDDPQWETAEAALTGNGLLAFCLLDDKGPLCYIRLDAEDELVRIAIQFGPESEVSKKRLVVGLIELGIPAMRKFAQENNYKGLVFESVNPSLIAFGNKQGFKSAGKDDYALIFEETNHV